MRATHRRCCTRGVCRRRVDRRTQKHPHPARSLNEAPARPPAHHPCTHPRTPPVHAPTHNVCTQPTHSGAAHAPTHNAPSCVQPRRCNTRYPPSSPCGRCARHTRTFHTSHTDSENGPRAEALFPAATPPGRMDTSSMTAHKAWSHFVDAAMLRWFSSRAPPKIDRGSHEVLCVREAWCSMCGESHCHRPRDDAKRWVDPCTWSFLRCVVEKSL